MLNVLDAAERLVGGVIGPSGATESRESGRVYMLHSSVLCPNSTVVGTVVVRSRASKAEPPA